MDGHGRLRKVRMVLFPGRLVLAFVILVGPASKVCANERPNILWIVAEDISPLFGCYGAPDARTPHIDRFAKRSHLFQRAYATAPICSPSRSCLATGMYATSLGTQNLRSIVELPEGMKPLARIFRENGYWTTLRGKTDYNFSAKGLFDSSNGKDGVFPWRSCPEGKPFFAFLNLGSTHEGSGNRLERAKLALKDFPQERKCDPAKVTLPPFYPDTPEMRRIWARYQDLITVFDGEVDKVLKQLEEDGRAEDTIVFLMSDHGMGLPRYKRWIHLTGLHVPLIVHVPKKYAGDLGASSVRDDLVSYVDLPATALKHAGIKVPEYFQGQSIFGKEKKELIFGARDRADDMYDLSRCVFDGRYLYIRHFLPHYPPMQQGYIMSPVYKESHIELHRVHDAGKDSADSRKIWESRPFEALYDLQKDPAELQNRAGDESLGELKKGLSERLHSWILETRDSAFLSEPEMHRRAHDAKVAPHVMMQDDKLYPIKLILAAAEAASEPNSDWLPGGDDPALDFWAIQQRIIRKDRSEDTRSFLRQKLKSENPTVRATAAEGLARLGEEDEAAPVFADLLTTSKEPNLLLYVARSLAVSFNDVRPIEKEVRAARAMMLAPEGSNRPWKDFVYSAFTSWALEWALVKSELNQWEDFKGL